MDFEKLYNRIKNPFRYTFVCYGLNGQAFLNWVFNNNMPSAGNLLFPQGIVDGHPQGPVMFDVADHWHTHAIIFDLDNSDNAVNAIKQIVMCDDAEVMKGEG